MTLKGIVKGAGVAALSVGVLAGCAAEDEGAAEEDYLVQEDVSGFYTEEELNTWAEEEGFYTEEELNTWAEEQGLLE